jgi:hypothetical protein
MTNTEAGKSVPNGSVEGRLIRMETKLDLVIGHNTKMNDDHESRLRGLERRFWIALGFAVASISLNAGQLLTYIAAP